MRILMVCLGNICRSPLAEGILQEKINQLELDWEVDSAGTSGWHAGEHPDPRSIEVATAHGIDISQQRSRQFSPYDFEQFDTIYVMDSGNYQDVISMANNEDEKAKVKLIMNMVEVGMNQAVPDPYWDDDGFEKVFGMLDKACNRIVNKYI